MNNHTTPKDFFLHLSATVVLYAVAIALINLSFSVINYFRPDQLAGYFSSGSVAWPISMLVVLVPILYVLEWLIKRDIVRMPEKKDIWIRRWRIYLTLFLAGALIVGDLIALINVYLSGEITARFGWKILAILIIAGAIFKYYILERLETYSRRALLQRTIAWVGVVLVIVAIVGGFAAVGSPSTQRAIRFDQRRVSDLSNLQWQVISYWQNKGSLPASLADLEDPISGSGMVKDPETEAPYGYVRKSATTFELCADFSRVSQDLAGRGDYGYGGGLMFPTRSYYPSPDGEQWTHEAGNVCFERTIDPDRYPVNPKPVR